MGYVVLNEKMASIIFSELKEKRKLTINEIVGDTVVDRGKYETREIEMKCDFNSYQSDVNLLSIRSSTYISFDYTIEYQSRSGNDIFEIYSDIFYLINEKNGIYLMLHDYQKNNEKIGEEIVIVDTKECTITTNLSPCMIMMLIRNNGVNGVKKLLYKDPVKVKELTRNFITV